LIIVDRINKEYRTRRNVHHVLSNVSLTIRRGESIGILGQNGAGKTTFVRVIAGVEYPTSGRVERRMTVSWPIGFGGGFQSSLTGADNTRFIARIYGVPIDRTVGFVKEFSELGEYFYMPVKTYSTGMRGRMAFAISLAVEFDCYLVDEVTAVGDQRFHDRCRAAMAERRARGALLMVSHNVATLRTYCDSGAVLHKGTLSYYEDLDDAISAYRMLQSTSRLQN